MWILLISYITRTQYVDELRGRITYMYFKCNLFQICIYRYINNIGINYIYILPGYVTCIYYVPSRTKPLRVFFLQLLKLP